MEPVLPVYHQIRRTIRHWILDKHYWAGEKIPTENELAKVFEVNRMTIRQALSSLVAEGLLNRKRGAGTFVTDNEELIQGLSLKHISLSNELLVPLMGSKTLSVEKAEIDAAPPVRNKLEMGPKDKFVTQLKRDRLVPGGIKAFTINYLPIEIGRKLDEKILLHKPLLKVLEDDLKINFTEAFQTIEVSISDEEASRHLGIPIGVSTFFTERIMYGEKGKPVEMVNTIYDAGLYKCCFNLKKVKRGDSTDWICQITN